MMMLMRRQEEAAAGPTLNNGDQAWVLASTALVFIMVPGVGYFYSGMARSKNALSLIFLSMLSLAVVGVEWFIWGYSLSLSENGSVFIGNLNHAFLMDVGDKPHPNGPTISGTVYCTYQSMFASITPALAFGAAAERSRILPALVFLFAWSTLVYNPVAYWTWAPNGWLRTLGSLDYAGGTPVHMNSGFAALAYALVVGRRQGFGKEQFKPHNYANIMLGTALLWFGWLGFNPGSAVAANGRAGIAAIVTNIAAATSGLTWLLLAYRHERKLSSFHFCSGAVAGLVAITPASGYVQPWAAFVFGIIAGAVCHFACDLKHRLGYDDALDVFAVHGVGGLVGNLLTGIFADASIATLDNASIPGGWINGNWIQLPIQLAASGAGAGWAFVITYIMLFIMDKIPALRLRVDEHEEILGLDASQMGELGYEHMAINEWERRDSGRSGASRCSG
ncbi:ammonium transporter AmtB-like domain-containing protein [Thamnocephalis sphaerospora]|uniref:Ammonium transporter n=1 Tax=Thamnocephalis sphaerospora TaxID=78915 RepID=A0A4P9XQ65_9FUNG|nr:ammonium transporter AmtB-like domain-containing protein [Thamnocephalis sphaerospora]|eukprot:RKP08174.1 ammonium transporter AmtB-like domain-containing protein [Thamnocephalis sphaerospora]